MATRHGKVARTPVSPCDPQALAHPESVGRRPSPGPTRRGANREELGRLMDERILVDADYQTRRRNRLALGRILDWLEEFPGEDWQARWLLSGADAEGQQWGPKGLTPALRGRFTMGLRTMVALRAVSPSYPWLAGSRQIGLYGAFRQLNEPETFAEIEQRTIGARSSEFAENAVNAITRIAIVTGRPLREIGLDDIEDYVADLRAAGARVSSLALAYDLLRAVGGLSGAPATLREAWAQGQLTVSQLVDRYPVQNKAVRDVLVHYLVERSAALDYASLVNHVQVLVDLFWCDLERHHPGIDSFRLSDEVAQAWKQRIRTLPDGRPRHTFHTALLTVRAFYLDLLHWSLEDPGRWGQWAAPSPVGPADIRGYVKESRQRKARMQQRTRALLPVLPQLLATAEQELELATAILAAARTADRGDEFTVDGKRYRRAGRGNSNWRPTALFVAPVDPAGNRFDAERLEDNAFWTSASIQVLRRTGARIEELLELTHLSLRQHQTPTGETIPLVQISPSKTDAERIIPADPELVSVLAKVVRRIKDENGHVPIVSRYDTYERTFGPRLPHLFQRTFQHRRQVINANNIREMLAGLAERAGIVDVDGTPLKFTPHDFRRVFSTETVNGGLPIHIAAKLLGHLDLNTTQGYVAVYPEEVIRRYREFVHQRRSQRPSEEYREPTSTEWAEFRDHFTLRKVALGRCDRPYGTPCQHESACVRCPMLHVAPTQMPRLLEIERNTHQRLDEAHRMQWLGEVANLKESLRHIAKKKQQAERLIQREQDSLPADEDLG